MANWLQKISPKPLTEVLQALVEVSLQGGDAVPTLSLYLVTGQNLHGQIVAADLRQARMLVLHELHGGSEHVHYVELDRVVGLTIHHAEAVAPTISFGAVDPAQLKEPPTPLALNRHLASFAESLGLDLGRNCAVSVDWTRIDRSDSAAMGSIDATAHALQTVLRKLSRDDFAKPIVAAKIQQVTIAVGESRALSLADGHLQVVVAPAAGIPGRYSDADLEAALNKLL